MYCVYHAFASVYWYLKVTCWEKANLLALVCDVKLYFVTFQGSIQGQVWDLIVLIPDLCRLFTFSDKGMTSTNSKIEKFQCPLGSYLALQQIFQVRAR